MISGAEEDTARIVMQMFPPDYSGVYVDVGAGYPEWYSNSYPFRARGWTIVAVEPQPSMCKEFRRRGYDVLEFACASQNLGIVDFEVLDNTRGLAGSAFKILDAHPPEAITTIKVVARTLDSLMSQFYPCIAHIDVLDVDVEYYELDVLRGVSFDRFNPYVLVIENLPTNTGVWINPHRDELYSFYDEIGYKIVGQAGHNEILVRKDNNRYDRVTL